MNLFFFCIGQNWFKMQIRANELVCIVTVMTICILQLMFAYIYFVLTRIATAITIVFISSFFCAHSTNSFYFKLLKSRERLIDIIFSIFANTGMWHEQDKMWYWVVHVSQNVFAFFLHLKQVLVQTESLTFWGCQGLCPLRYRCTKLTLSLF